MKSIISLLMLLACLSVPAFPQASEPNTENRLEQLDKSLAAKRQYEEQKLNDIKEVKMSMVSASPSGRLAAYRVLFSQYSSYQYDSAYVYANHLLTEARRLKSADYEVEARCDLVFCLLSAGLYKEAFDALAAIHTDGTTAAARKLYFTTASRLYYDVSDYTRTQPYQQQYIRQGGIYTDSLLHYLRRGSAEWLYAVGIRQMKEEKYAACLDTFNQFLKQKDVDVHQKAIVTSCLGWVYLFMKNDGQAVDYLAQAAIYDNVGAIRETTALCTLARLLYRKGDIQRATEYVRQSLSNANFYGARQRVIEVSSILPIIEQDRFKVMQGQRNAIAIAAIIAILFVLGLLMSWWFIRRQMLKLKMAQQTIARRNGQLEKKNNQLEEVNKIKDEYIGKSFYINSEYINKVEKLYRTIDRKIATQRFEDLRSSLKESELIAERKSMFADFDETFLKLFPQFIEKYNELFPHSEQKPSEKPNQLTTEMRIFALIRLGINDSERIAKFLNYSVHTINTYKTRVKNRSNIDNDQFERRIMEI
ncbi:MAG: DUF6377 domain-containing protein [Prevotella sp.]|nr:DUF6377 domain-containing protein [Prevotella sp.]